MDFSKIVDWIKLSPKYLFAIAVAAGFLLFAPSSTLATLGLIPLITQYKTFIGAAFLISSVLFLVHPLTEAYDLLSTRIMVTMVVRSQQKDLHELTEDKKEVLRRYIYGKTQSQYLSPVDGVTNGLEAKMIIYRASNIGRLHQFAYNIHPWAWKYLNRNSELLLPRRNQKGE